MFITENQNIGDSVLFLMAARASLTNIIEEGNTEKGPDLISFIRNEASDYQVMNLLLHGTLPEEKYDAVAEALLFSDLKESMLMNKDFVTEIVGEDIFDNVLNEVDSLYMGTSTQAPILEFASQTDPVVGLALHISEVDAVAAKAAIAKKIAAWKVQAASASGAAKAAILKKMAAAKAQMAAYANSAKASAAYHGGTAKAALAKKVTAGKAAVGKAAAAVKGAAVKGAAATSKFATTKAGIATGGAAAGALAIYAGYKIYKRFLSQAAKACGGQSGAAKTACMAKYKKQAIIKQASAIQSASGTCAKSKDPAKCKAAVSKKVAALKAKAAKIAA